VRYAHRVTPTEWIGRVVDGRYVVEALVGRGGMGMVLAARHKFTGARVALKMVRADLGLDAEIEARFLAEARVPATIGHRSVVQTIDAGKTPEGELYLVMELLAGRSLRHDLMRGVGAPSARRIGMELLDVLAAAHARGIVHRDVKPENVFLVEPDASVKLLDFGITKVLTGSRSILPRTAAGVLLGTIEYMAPEQLADARGVDARADLWAVSVILYEMLAGRRPYRATTTEEMFTALVTGEPDPIRIALPSAPPEFDAFFARALAREPQHRFASAGEMAMALARLPLGAAAAVAAKPASGNVTMATGFAATAATPGSGVPGLARPPTPAPVAPVPVAPMPVAPMPVAPMPPGRVLTPFAATPALAGALPQTPPPGTVPGRHQGVGPPPTTGTIATVARTIETSVAAPRRRYGVVLGAIGAVMIGAAIVVAATRGSDVPGPPPPPGPAPSKPAVAVAPTTPATPPSPDPAPSKPAVAAPSPSAGSTVAALPVPPPGPTPATTRKRGSTAKNAPADPAPEPPAMPRRPEPSSSPGPVGPAPLADTCTAGCKMLASCRLGSGSCEADCARNRTLSGCLQHAAGDCNRFASCWFASSCRGYTPTGTHSCSEAMDCEATCRNDPACICSCIAGMSPRHAVALLAYNGCALPCRDADCIAQRCAAQARRCRAQ
jgi:eukaryotic-like serine/threonine-protein kinase